MTDNKQMNDWYRANQERLRGVGKFSNDESFDSVFVPPNTMNHSLSPYQFPRPKNYAFKPSYFTLRTQDWMWLKDTTIRYNSSILSNSYLENVRMTSEYGTYRLDIRRNEIKDCDMDLTMQRYLRFDNNDMLNSKFKLNANDEDNTNRLKDSSIIGCDFKDSILRGLKMERNTIISSQFISSNFLDAYIYGNLIMDSSFESIKFWRMNISMWSAFNDRNTSLEQLDSIIKNPQFLNCSFNKVNFKESRWEGTTYFTAKGEIERRRGETDLLDDYKYQNLYHRFDSCNFDAVKMQNMASMERIQFSNCTFNKTKLSPSYSRYFFKDIDMKNTTFTKCNLTGSKFTYSGDSNSRRVLRRYRFFSRNNRHPKMEEWKREIESSGYTFPRTIEECTFNNCSFKNYSMETTFRNAMMRDVEFNFKRARGFSRPANESFLHFKRCSLMDVRFEDSEIGALKFDNCVVALSFKDSNIGQLYLTHDTTLEFGRRVSNFENAVVEIGKIDGLFERYNFTNATFGTESQGVDFSNSDITPEKLESVGATFQNCTFPNEEELEEAEGDARRSAIDQLVLRPNDSDIFVVDNDEYDDYEDNEPLGNESLSGIFSEQELEEMANDSDFGWDDEGMAR